MYNRRIADIDKDRKIALAKGKNADVVEAKAAQRKADAEDDRAKRMGLDRTATRKAEYDAEQRLSRTRKFGADKPVAAAEPIKASVPAAAAATPVAEKAKPKSTREEFNAAFREARNDPAAMKRGTFTFKGTTYTTKMAGEGPKRTVTVNPSRTNNSAATPSRTGTGTGATPKNQDSAAAPLAVAKNNPPAGAPKRDTTVAILQATKAAREKTAKTPSPTAAPAPIPKRYETLEQAKARVAKLTGAAKARNNFAGVFGIDSVSNAKARASLLATREAEKARNAARSKGNSPLASGTDTRAFFTYGDAAAKKNAANKAKGGKIMKKYAKGGSTPPQPTPAERASDAKFRASIKNIKVTPEQGKILDKTGKKYAKGGVTKQMPSSNQMGSMNMAKGGKAKMKPAAKGKAKGNPFAATKFGAAMMKKSADTEGRGMKKFAKGGSIDGCAQRGKTKLKRVTMARGGMMKKGGKTC
jgi:hypothetical protein